MISRHKKYININVYGACYGGNWLHILLKMSGSFGCVVTSKQCYYLDCRATSEYSAYNKVLYQFLVE